MNKHLLISWLQSLSAVILEPRKIKSATVSTVSPSISHEVMGLDAFYHKSGVIYISEVIDISPSNLDFSLWFIQPRVLPEVVCIELNKQGDNIQLWHTPFPILSQSVVPCLILTVASWPTYMFLRRQWWTSPINAPFRYQKWVLKMQIASYEKKWNTNSHAVRKLNWTKIKLSPMSS